MPLALFGELIMEKYIHDENLKLFRQVLAETTDDEKRARLIDLIRDEVAKETLPKCEDRFEPV
jgi:hypothetical protein